MTGKQNLVVFGGIGLILFRYFSSYQRNLLNASSFKTVSKSINVNPTIKTTTPSGSTRIGPQVINRGA